ncbi:zinc ABC transporter substrate-binding protein [Simiduia curdlanivorans]|uniref:High-affinity zinc uptake system protein ZnuA n=1 Tax=Simiduia curdlanivorans TaxID=1492769 RepID=A0ABV8V1J5_9GAMM|nr:zinc ABC transporter substrate-binding protein [Simiduia curdlanivorans]MDN3638142.1 zinc ABC transporter substrate-binding protein [Simiduia curdlanivorans]
MNLFRALVFLLALSGSLSVFAAKLVVSIEPLAMLVEPLLGPDDSLRVLLKPNTSPHHYSLKASDMRALQQADLILWVGPELEQFLQKPLATLPAALQLDQLAQLSWPDQAELSEPHHSHAHTARDPHLWLNPDNALAVANAVAQRLQALAGVDGAVVQARLAVMQTRIAALSVELERDLGELRELQFMVYHQAYGHWNQRFGLTQLSAVSLTPEQKPGARHIYQLKERAKDAQCLLAEAFYDNQSTQQLAKELGLPLVLLDPLGTNVAPGEHRYETLMRNLAADMKACLNHPANS